MDAIESILKEVDLFDALPKSECTKLRQAARLTFAAKGKQLFQRSETPRYAHLLVRGSVSLSLVSPNGMEKIVDIVRPVRLFGEEAAVLGDPYATSAQALDDAHILMIRREPFVQCMETNRELTMRLLRGLGGRVQELIHDIESYSLCSGAQRVAEFLLREAPAEPAAGAAIRVELPISKSVMASRLNLAPETLSRTLKILSQNGVISVHGATIEVHGLARLRAAAASPCTRGGRPALSTEGGE